MIKATNTLLTVIAGVAAALVFFWVLNWLVERLPGKWEHRFKPYVYIAPAFLAIVAYLVYPAILTVIDSFKNPLSDGFVGFANYKHLISSNEFHEAFFNTILWVLFVPVISIILGLGVAVLVDRLRPSGEKTAKTLIFMPMAISAVGAATVWRFVYAYNVPGQPQVGLLNAIVTGLGKSPVAWLTISTLRFNSFLLMVMMLWAQVGFSMVLLSAAVKGVPVETLEAARIDGANERQIFRRVVIPQIWPTIITVYVTVVITVMKVFDIVYVMTNGNFQTNVVGVEFFNQLFTNFDNGIASAIVVILLIAVVPVMVFQVRQFKSQEAAR
jgi:alpha-glucoside transport system permease protein